MLFVDGQMMGLIAVVVVLTASALIALIMREAPSEPTKPTVLSEEDRLLLQSMALEARKQERANSKKARGRQAQREKDERESDS